MKDLTGMKFSRLTVVSFSDFRGQPRRAFWNVVCECGQIKKVWSGNLVSGGVKSCGCLRSEVSRAMAIATPHSRRHGLTGTKEWLTWMAMKDRCYHPGSTSYYNYGARGIRVCESWMVFENFFADMGLCPPGHSIDRIDNNGNYEPSNCRWASKDTQSNNKRNAILITVDGLTMSAKQWSNHLGCSYMVIRYQGKKLGGDYASVIRKIKESKTQR